WTTASNRPSPANCSTSPVSRPNTTSTTDPSPRNTAPRSALTASASHAPTRPPYLQRRRAPQTREDQRRLGTRHLRVGIEVLYHERPQILRVAGRDVQDEVVGARQEVDVHHLWFAADLRDEIANLAARVGLQRHRDHRLQRQTDGGRIDVGVEATDDAELLQPSDPPMTRRRGDPDRLRQRAVGHPRIGV